MNYLGGPNVFKGLLVKGDRKYKKKGEGDMSQKNQTFFCILERGCESRD